MNVTPKSRMPGNQTQLPSPPTTRASLSYRARENFVPDEKHSNSQIPLRKGEMVEVTDKLDIGWWYVVTQSAEGWVPASCLEDPTGRKEDVVKVYKTLGSPEGKPYIVTKSHLAVEADELSIKQGTSVTVLEKNSDGWWLAEFNGVRGMVPGCCLAPRDAANGIGHVKEPETVPAVSQSPAAKNAQATLATVNHTSPETSKPKPVPKPRHVVAACFPSQLASSPPSSLPSPSTSPLPAPRQTSDPRQPATKEESSLERSPDEEAAHSCRDKPRPPPPSKTSAGPTKQTALAKKGTQTAESKVLRVLDYEVITLGTISEIDSQETQGTQTAERKVLRVLDYEVTTLGTISEIDSQETQVMPKPSNNGCMEVRGEDDRKGSAQKECIEKTKKPSPGKTRGKQKCDVQDIEDAYWSGDALEGERILHNIKREGTFMVRTSRSKADQETLLVFADGKIIKYKIKHKQGTGYALSKTAPIFESFDELIFFYSSNFLPEVATKLQVPYQRLMTIK